MLNTTSASSLGRELYHDTWKLVAENFFDKSRLTDWASWQHRYDEQIVDEESALRFVDEMLASLKDEFTQRKVPSIAPTAAPSPVTLSSETATEEQPAVTAVLSPSKIGYIRIDTFDREDIVELVEAGVAKLKGCEGVILDLRNNVGGGVEKALECCTHFLVDGLLATLKFRHEGGLRVREYLLNGNQFFWKDELPDGSEKTKLLTRHAPSLALKPIVLLMNRRTMSAAEVMIVTLVQNGFPGMVTMVGSAATPGKGIGQMDFEVLGGKYTVRITVCHWFAPGGEWLGDFGQTVSNGIEPDTLVPNDRGPEALEVAAKALRKMLGREEPAQ
jgi:C-terminal processing protease CtpA/Prc